MREESQIPTLTGRKFEMILQTDKKIPLAVIGSSSMVGSRFCELASTSFNLCKADLKGVVSINIKGTANVVDACKNSNRKLIFISTDFVFDGQNGPYSEESQPGGDLDKISWYGLTKIEAENYVRENLANFLILRIAYPYRGRFEGKDDIAKRILRLYQVGQLYPMFTDQIITPTFIDDIAEAVKLLVSTDKRGILHLVSPRQTTQFEFAKELIRVFKGDISKIQKGSIIDFLKIPGHTPRPINGGLKVEKTKALGFQPTDWQEGIKIIHEQSKGHMV